jgi:hypothetical protein
LSINPKPIELTQSSWLKAPLIPKNAWFRIGGGGGGVSLTIFGLIDAENFLSTILFSLTVNVQVIVLGFKALLWISQFCFRLRIVIEMENSDISRMFQICSLKETTNPEYIEKFISELYPEWTSLLDSFWTLLL